MVESSCQPVLKDHNSRWLECKRQFLLATLIAKSFTFVFDCSGEIILPSIFWSTEVTSQTCLLKFPACYFPRELFFWSLDASLLVPLLCNFVNWESMGKLFKTWIICIERIIFKIWMICRISVDNFASSVDLLMHPIGNKLFKIRIICGISFNNFASSFWSLSTWKLWMMTLYRTPKEVYLGTSKFYERTQLLQLQLR